MATVNAASHYRLDHDLGSISPGRFADLLIVEDLENLSPKMVITNGVVVAQDGEYQIETEEFQFPRWAKETMNLRRVTAEDFELRVNKGIREAQVRVIQQLSESPFRVFKMMKIPVEEGKLALDFTRGLNLVAVVDRHSGETKIGRGIIDGYGLRSGAIATSVSHDSHNITVLGTNREDMALCVNTLAEVGGGFTAAKEGSVLAVVEFEVAGLISGRPYEKVVEELERFEHGIQAELGFPAEMPFIAVNFIALACSPFEAGISDLGLIDARAEARCIVPLLVETIS
jgi:adenine deaminase